MQLSLCECKQQRQRQRQRRRQRQRAFGANYHQRAALVSVERGAEGRNTKKSTYPNYKPRYRTGQTSHAQAKVQMRQPGVFGPGPNAPDQTPQERNPKIGCSRERKGRRRPKVASNQCGEEWYRQGARGPARPPAPSARDRGGSPRGAAARCAAVFGARGQRSSSLVNTSAVTS